MEIYTLNHGIFHGATMFVIGGTAKEAVEKLEPDNEWIEPLKDVSDENFQNTNGVCSFREVNGVKYYFIFLHKGFDHKPESYVTLSHEILHLCQFLLPDFINRDVEHEAEAYFHSHIMSQCLECIEEYNKPKEVSNKVDSEPSIARWNHWEYNGVKFMQPNPAYYTTSSELLK